MATKLTAEALEGYGSQPVRYLASSACWFAYELGRYFQVTGRCAPRDVRMGRGYTIHASDMTFRHTGNFDNSANPVQMFERIK